MVHMSEFTFLSSDERSRVCCRQYLPEGEAKAVVQIAHGIAEHIGRYDGFARFLAEHGYIVVGNDHLGHGRTAGSGSLGSFGENHGWELAVEDMHRLHDLTAARFPGKPYFLFGHSMGSFLSRTYIIRYRSGLDGVILSGTGHQNTLTVNGGKLLSRLESRRHGSAFPSRELNDLAFGKYTDRIPAPRTKSDWLTRDEAAVDAYEADPLCGFVPSAGLFRDMMGGIFFVTRSKNINRMSKDLPVYFLSGDCDPVGDYGKGVIRAYKSFLRAGMTDVTMKLYHGGRHEMLNEINSDEVFHDILAWLDAKVGK